MLVPKPFASWTLRHFRSLLFRSHVPTAHGVAHGRIRVRLSTPRAECLGQLASVAGLVLEETWNAPKANCRIGW